MTKIFSRVTVFVVAIVGFLEFPLSAQHLTLISVDSTQFPKMSARVFSVPNNEGTRDVSTMVIEVRDSKNVCSTTVSASPYSLAPKPVSILICADISQSTEEFVSLKNLVRLSSETIASGFSDGSACLALTFFDNHSHIACDYTTDRSKFLNSLNKVFTGRATGYTEAFLQDRTGALEIPAPAGKNHFMVLVTDGIDTLDIERIVSKAKSEQFTVFCLGIGSFSSPHLKQMTEATGGLFFSNLRDSMQVRDAAATIAGIANGAKCLDVNWISSDVSSAKHPVDIRVTGSNHNLSLEYGVPDQKRAILEHPSHLSFGRVPPGSSTSAMIALHAVNYDITIDSISVQGMPFFSTSVQYPLVVKAFTTVNIPANYSPKDSGVTWSRFVLHSSQYGTSSVTLSGGFQGHASSGKTLKLLNPREGQILSVDSYYPIDWEGCAPEDYCRVDMSYDGGSTWRTLQENVRGTMYMMKTPREPHENVKIRVSQKSSMTNGSLGIQTTESPSAFSIVDPSTFVQEVRVNPTLIGERKDKTSQDFIRNKTQLPLQVESVEIVGENPQDFKLCSQAPPYTLAPGESHPIEVSFSPTTKGTRSARISMKTSAGFAVARLSGYGLEKSIEIHPTMVDFGMVEVGDSVTMNVATALYNKTDAPYTLRKLFLIGPDTTQFFINSILAEKQLLKAKEPLGLRFTFRPKTQGRTSSEVVVVSDAEDSPHIIQLYGNGSDNVKDPTDYRSIVSPTASTLRAGALSLASYDVLGVLAGYGVTDNLMLLAGGVIPVPLGSRTTLLFSAGAKYGMNIARNLNVAAGYQFVKSRTDLKETPEVESNVTVHAPYLVGTYGNDDARASLAFGYAFKHHITSDTIEFDKDALLVTVSSDIRISARWKICAEAYSFRTLGYVPIVASARFLQPNYTLDFGFSYFGITTGDTKAASVPLVPVFALTWMF